MVRPPKLYSLKTIYFVRDDGTLTKKDVEIPSYTIRRSKKRSTNQNPGIETPTVPNLSPSVPNLSPTVDYNQELNPDDSDGFFFNSFFFDPDNSAQ